jgi:two-component system, cell cycle sensor histidine kinase and response regulator CckA
MRSLRAQNIRDSNVATEAPTSKSGGPVKEVILLIEDEADICNAFSEALSEQDVSVVTAQTGELGIELYRTHKEEVNLVVLDLSLPGMSGEDTFRVLRRINPNVKVVISSGYGDQYVKKLFKGVALLGTLQKPYTWGALVENMTKFLAMIRTKPG